MMVGTVQKNNKIVLFSIELSQHGMLQIHDEISHTRGFNTSGATHRLTISNFSQTHQSTKKRRYT